MTYIYSLYDAKTGELRHEGTPGELMKAGVFGQSEEASRMWTRQHLKGAVPAKWRVERRRKMPQKKRDPDRKPGVQKRQIWEYSLYDAQVKLIGRGTAEELVKAGYFAQEQDAANAFYAGQSRRLGVCSIGRRKVWREVSCRTKGPQPGGTAAKTAKLKRLPGGLALETPLQRDVHELCLYNEKAHRMGRKELSYGWWKAAGAPEEPL